MEYSNIIEWNILQKESVLDKNHIEKVEIINSIDLNDIEFIKLSRGENYQLFLNICIKMAMEETINKNYEHFHNVYGRKIDKIIIKTRFSVFYLENCHLLNIKLEPLNLIFDDYKKFNLKFNITNIEKQHRIDNEEKEESIFVREWYINGPYNVCFKQRSNISNQSRYIKTSNNPKIKDISINFDGGSYSSGFLFVELNDCSFIIEKVPDKFSPTWSKKLSIEYQKNLKIPTPETRQKIRQTLSFLFGRSLIKVGETHYDKNWNVIKNYSIDSKISSRINLRNICQQYNKPTISMGFYDNSENNLSQIINSYLQEKKLDLSEAIKYLLYSTTIPIESEIILINSSMDSIKNKWSELPENSKKDNDFKLFLSEFGLEMGDEEKKARKFRNAFAHAEDITGDANELVYSTRVYRSFVNRLILKILGHDRYYDLANERDLKITDNISDKGFDGFKILQGFQTVNKEDDFNKSQEYIHIIHDILLRVDKDGKMVRKWFSDNANFISDEHSSNIKLFKKGIDKNNSNFNIALFELVEFKNKKYIIQLVTPTKENYNKLEKYMNTFNQINKLKPLKI